jgi:hypothetical protein
VPLGANWFSCWSAAGKSDKARRKKEEGRRKKEEGRRKTEDGRRKTEEIKIMMRFNA